MLNTLTSALKPFSDLLSHYGFSLRRLSAKRPEYKFDVLPWKLFFFKTPSCNVHIFYSDNKLSVQSFDYETLFFSATRTGGFLSGITLQPSLGLADPNVGTKPTATQPSMT